MMKDLYKLHIDEKPPKMLYCITRISVSRCTVYALNGFPAG